MKHEGRKWTNVDSIVETCLCKDILKIWKGSQKITMYKNTIMKPIWSRLQK